MPFNPIDNPVDVVRIGGVNTPGIAIVAGANSPRRWDIRRGYAYTGEIAVFRGNKLAEFSVLVQLWEAEHFDEWREFIQPLLRPPIGRASRHFDIVHPVTESVGISQIRIIDVLPPNRLTDDGLWQGEIKCGEYRAPVRTISAPDEAQSEETDPVSALIEQRRQQLAQSLARE